MPPAKYMNSLIEYVKRKDMKMTNRYTLPNSDNTLSVRSASPSQQ